MTKPPRASSEAASRRMKANRGRDTKPELLVRRLLHRRGLRYFVDHAPLPGLRRRADIVFPKCRVAVFIDGCFWHGCPQHGTQTKENRRYWRDKILKNKKRDCDTDQRLVEAGWEVLRFWEHEDATSVVQRIEDIIRTS